MALQAVFEAFLRNPTSSVLADDASISYIPTLTTINEPSAIIKHLQAQGRQLKKNAEATIDAVEGGNGLYLDTETTLEFVTGGGAYLPGLDDNFLADKVATLPLSYVVRFDEQQKIHHVRVYWEQASLLKQLEVIGARGRNWPIREGKDQVRLIREKSKLSPTADASVDRPATASSRRTTATSDSSNDVRSHSSSTSAVRGEKSSLSLFQPREEDERNYTTSGAEVVSPRESARPTHRDLSDILAQAHLEEQERPISPAKKGAGKNYGASRLFEQEELDVQPKPANDIKLDPRKFQHFEFGDGDEQDDPAARLAAQKAAEERRKKHTSQWNFEDFVTPDKPRLKVLPQNARNFSWSDDEGETSPVKRLPVVHKERKDAKPHFEFTDEATPVATNKKQPQPPQQSQTQQTTAIATTRTITNKSNAGQGLYEDHVILSDTGADDGADTPTAKKPLATATNISNANRQRDFDAHYTMSDVSPTLAPADAAAVAANGGDRNKENSHAGAGAANGKINEGQKKVLTALSSNWDLYDNSPDATAPREKKIYKTSGNGMGGRKDAAAHWAFGDEDFTEETPARSTARTSGTQQASKSFWDF